MKSLELLDYIEKATSPFHVIEESAAFLRENGFEELNMGSLWNLEKGGHYYTTLYGTTLYAFTLGKDLDLSGEPAFHIAAAHTDYPCLRVKPNPEMSDKNYLKINIEPYGGLIRNTWLDRPLSIAGKVALKSDSIFKPETRLVDFRRPVVTVPGLAIHMNREVNKGVEINPQTELLPLLATMEEGLNKDSFFMDFLAKELGVETSSILDFDLYIYNAEAGCKIGMKEDFISAPRLDNLTSCAACLNGIVNQSKEDQINVIALFDNEEIGSRTKQGADSVNTNVLLEKIYAALGKDSVSLYSAVMNSFMISIDVAHGYHPNYGGKNDPTNVTQLNEGVILKLNSNQRYATDTEAVASIQQLCESYDIPYQKFVNRSDVAGGGTLGSLTSSWLPMKTVDMGVGLLSMHSARELMGMKDQDSLNRLVTAFFQA